MGEPTYMVALTARELEAASWCVNTLSSSWLGAPDGTAIHGLKAKLAEASDSVRPLGAPAKAVGITG